MTITKTTTYYTDGTALLHKSGRCELCGKQAKRQVTLKCRRGYDSGQKQADEWFHKPLIHVRCWDKVARSIYS